MGSEFGTRGRLVYILCFSLRVRALRLPTRTLPPSPAAMVAEAISEDLKRAVKLFNRWQFQEAHEAFVSLAAEVEGRDKQFLEALANLSAAFYRIWHKGGEANAMVAYLQKGMEQIKPYRRGAMGLVQEGFYEALVACLDEAMTWRRGDEEIYNRDIIPRLEFEGVPVD